MLETVRVKINVRNCEETLSTRNHKKKKIVMTVMVTDFICVNLPLQMVWGRSRGSR